MIYLILLVIHLMIGLTLVHSFYDTLINSINKECERDARIKTIFETKPKLALGLIILGCIILWPITFRIRKM
jgi:hypothetical protein